MTRLDELSRELLLRVDQAGVIVDADVRAARKLDARAGRRLVELAVPGTEDKVARMLEDLGAPLPDQDGWELSMVAEGRPTTVSFVAVGVEAGAVLLLGTLIPEHFARAFDEVQQAMGEVVRLHRETVSQKRELERRHDELRRVHSELNESNQGVVSLHAEIADKADEMHRQAEIKSRVIANVSHEFRTPLHSILGLTQLLMDGADGDLNPEQQKQVQFIRSSTEELLGLVNDVLDLTKVEAGRASLRAEKFTLGDLMSSMRGMLRPLLPPTSPVKLVCDDADGVTQLETDRGKLSQIVRNLVSNALKFTEQGEVRVSSDVLDGGRQVRFTVRDTGIGIPPEQLDRVFLEFVQVESPIQGRVKGTGLGLPLAQRLTEMLGGEIRVESQVGVGSTFSVTIPALHPEVSEMHRVEERGARRPIGSTSILVVEDDRKTIFIYEKYLSLAGFHVVAARTIDAARALLARARPAAIVLDIVLEEETSWQFLAEVKRNPYTADIPVLVVTVTNREQKARALGADEFWLKPIDQERLLRKLKGLARANPAPRVLIIDDDEKSRYLMRKHLRDSTYKLLEASSGPEGVALAQARLPHVIFLDFLLQDMTAFDVLDDLKADPRTRAIPVIIVTSQILDAVDKQRLLNEAEAVISKESLSRELAMNRIRDALAKAGVHGAAV